MNLTLLLLPDRLAVCQLSSDSPFPSWAEGKNILSLTRTTDELSIICESAAVPENIIAERGWRALKIQGPLDFSLVSILNTLTATLAKAEISIFAISTYNTDYVLLKEHNLFKGKKTLCQAGYTILEA
jgi:hypothetical protein